MATLREQRKKKPFKPQRELKNPRTMSRLRTYKKRRDRYNASAALVLAMFILRYLPEIRAMRAEQLRVAARQGNKLRQRRHRKRIRIEARIARLQERRTVLRSEIATLEERVQLKEMHLRRHGTKHAGFVRGWAATEDLSPEEEKTWAKRYVIGFHEARADRKRVDSMMAAQQAKPLAQPQVITL